MHLQSDKNKYELMNDLLDGLEPEELRHLVKDAYEGEEEIFLNKFNPSWREELKAMNTKRYAQVDDDELKNRLLDYIYEASDEFGFKLMQFEESILEKVRNNVYTENQIAKMVLPLVQAAAKSFEEYYETEAFDITTLDAVALSIAKDMIKTTRPGMLFGTNVPNSFAEEEMEKKSNHLKKAIKIISQQMEPEIIEGDWVEVDGPEGTEWVPLEYVDLADVKKLSMDLQFPEEGKLIKAPLKGTSLEEYCENTEIWEIHVREGWFGARLSASGYLDVTGWAVFPTKEDAEAFLKEEESLSGEEDEEDIDEEIDEE